MLVSVAMATHNGAKFLRQQLDSIFRQTYRPIEVIAVDDCSTDETVTILKEYSELFPLRYTVNENRLGFVKNFERAISLCQGAYVALADQDDEWIPQKIDILLSHIGSRSLVCSDLSLIDENGACLASSFRRSLKLPIADMSGQFQSLAFMNFIQGCTCLFRKEFIRTILPIPAEAMSHDWWMGIRATQLNGIAYVDQPLVLYRQHGANTIGAQKMWKISGAVRYAFSGARKEVMIRERARIRYYLDHGIYSGHDQKELLGDLYAHYDSIVKTKIHVRAFAIAVRHRHVLLPNIGPVSRWIYLLGRLV